MRRMGYEEAAKMAGLSPRKIRYAVYAGELVARRCGRRVLISESDLNDWLDGMPLVVAGDDIAELDIDDIDDETMRDGDVADHPREDATRTRAASVSDVHQVAA